MIIRAIMSKRIPMYQNGCVINNVMLNPPKILKALRTKLEPLKHEGVSESILWTEDLFPDLHPLEIDLYCESKPKMKQIKDIDLLPEERFPVELELHNKLLQEQLLHLLTQRKSTCSLQHQQSHLNAPHILNFRKY